MDGADSVSDRRVTVDEQILRLIEEGRAAITAEEVARIAEQDAQQAAEAQERKVAQRTLYAAAVQAVPEMVRPYVTLEDEILSGYIGHVRLNVPECRPVAMGMSRTRGRDDGWGPWTWDGNYHVARPWKIGTSDMADEVLYIRHIVQTTEDLAIALAWAAEGYGREEEMKREIAERLEQAKSEQARLAEMQERWRVEGEARAAAEQEDALMERERLLAAVEHDPVVMGVLRLLVAVQEDRWQLLNDLIEAG